MIPYAEIPEPANEDVIVDGPGCDEEWSKKRKRPGRDFVRPEVCPICDDPMPAGGEGQTCSLACGQRLRHQRDGFAKPLTYKGYVRVWCPGHPTAAADGYAREHRKVAWDHGILIDLDMQVHHINGDKTDNRPENLMQLDASEHKRHHVQEDGYIENQFGVFPLQEGTCSEDDCDRPTRHRGLCRRHYKLWRAEVSG